MTEEENRLLEDDSDAAEDKPQLSIAKQNCMLITVLSLQLCSLCADTLIYPFFPKIAAIRGWGNFHTGIVFASFDMAKFIASPIAGSLLLKWHPKAMCTFGNLLTALSCVAFGSANLIKNDYWFLGLCVVIRLCAGVGSAILTVASTSLLMKATTYKANTVMMLIEIVQGTGYAAGPMYGALLFMATGYSPMFWILGGIMVIFLPAFIIIVPKVEETDKSTNKRFIDLLRIPGCSLMMLQTFIMRFCSRSPGISNWITEGLHKSADTVSILFGIWSIIYIIFSCPISSALVRKGFIYETMIIGWFASGAFSLFIGPTPLLDFIFHGHRYLWLTAAAVSGIYFLVAGLLIPSFQAALNLARVSGHESDSLHTYGMVTGLVNCGISLGSTLGPIFSGMITDATNYAWTNTVFTGLSWSMGILLSAYILYMRLTDQPLSSKEESEPTETTTVKAKVTAKDIAAACAAKFNKVLHSNDKPTKVSHVQEE